MWFLGLAGQGGERYWLHYVARFVDLHRAALRLLCALRQVTGKSLEVRIDLSSLRHLAAECV